MKKAFAFIFLLSFLFVLVNVNKWSLRNSIAQFATRLNESNLQNPQKQSLNYHLLKEENKELKQALFQKKQLKSFDEENNNKIQFANVIFYPKQNPTFCWIDKGDSNAKDIKKNSVVCFGNVVVGVVEKVLKTTSLVRLLTNPQLNVSVRLQRGSIEVQNAQLAIRVLKENGHLNAKEKHDLKTIESRLLQKSKEHHLAKGFMCGLKNNAPNRLVGLGFQYDFSDEYGPNSNDSLLELGDILVTTGYDGIFPRGLQVGIVVDFKKKEQDLNYSIEALTLIDYNHLQTVLILPPLNEEVLNEN